MTALEQATELQQRAVGILLAERDAIDARLQQLGYGEIKTALSKKRGRPCKEAMPLPSDASDTRTLPDSHIS